MEIVLGITVLVIAIGIAVFVENDFPSQRPPPWMQMPYRKHRELLAFFIAEACFQYLYDRNRGLYWCGFIAHHRTFGGSFIDFVTWVTTTTQP